MTRRAAITIDVDGLRLYQKIHGLPQSALAEDPIYSVALPRFFELLDRIGVPATLFVVGEDALHHKRAFEPARRLGCEIGNHSFAHDYRLSRQDVDTLREDLRRSEAALAPIAGHGKVVGFRAPGYNVSPALLRCLVERGYWYDSSLLPAPAYWGARATAIFAHRLARRRSSSLIGQWRAFAGPTEPYRCHPQTPWRRSDTGPLLEFPMTCDPWIRAPLIGTSWVFLPPAIQRAWLSTYLRRSDYFVFEMHAIDLLDHTDSGIPSALVPFQADLRVPVAQKIDAFTFLFRRLRDAADTQTLQTWASQFEG